MSKKLALCIGINNYPGTGSDLSGCVNDAHDWTAAFKKFGFSVQSLIDKQATKQAILSTIKKIISSTAKGDSIVIQYSGHGTYIPDENNDELDGTDECICPYDISSVGPITDDELYELFSAKSNGVKLVMFSDSCNSGTVTKFVPISTPPTILGVNPPQRKVRFLPPATFLKKKDIDKLGTARTFRRSSAPGRHGALLMAGCQDVEYSYDAVFNNRPNGAFTFVALDCLKKLSADSTYRDWHKAIRKVLPSQQYPQAPNLFGSKTMTAWKVLS